MSRRWWKRNLLALVVIATSVPALAWLLGGVVMTERLADEPRVVSVAAGEPVEFGGYRWTLTASDSFEPRDSEGESRPVGAELVAAIISAEPIPGADPGDKNCEAKLTVPGPERNRRSWDRINSPADYQYRTADDTRGYCSLDGTAFEYEVVYLAPDGTYETASIDLILAGSRTIHRLQLEQ